MKGQALIEYILILGLMGSLAVQVVKGFSNFMNERSGGLAYVLTIHLTVGVCQRDCFFSGYVNGPEP